MPVTPPEAGEVWIWNVTLLAPAGTVTVAGTMMLLGNVLVRLTSHPPAGAAADSFTVPVAPAVLTIGFGETNTEVTWSSSTVSVALA